MLEMISALVGWEYFGVIVIPILIFLIRIVDVTMGTVRIIFVSKGLKHLAPIVGFFEVLIWLFAIAQIMQNLTNISNYIAYAAGFATGTYLGIYLESRLAMGYLSVSVMTKKEPTELIEKLESSGYRTTAIDARGKDTKTTVKMIFTVVKRSKIRSATSIIKNFDPKAFYSIEEVRYMHEMHVPHPKHHHYKIKKKLFTPWSKRKGK